MSEFNFYTVLCSVLSTLIVKLYNSSYVDGTGGCEIETVLHISITLPLS